MQTYFPLTARARLEASQLFGGHLAPISVHIYNLRGEGDILWLEEGGDGAVDVEAGSDVVDSTEAIGKGRVIQYLMGCAVKELEVIRIVDVVVTMEEVEAYTSQNAELLPGHKVLNG